MTRKFTSAMDFIAYYESGEVADILIQAYGSIVESFNDRILTEEGLFFHIVLGTEIEERHHVIMIEGYFVSHDGEKIPVFSHIIVSDEGFTDEMMDRSNELEKKEGYQTASPTRQPDKPHTLTK